MLLEFRKGVYFNLEDQERLSGDISIWTMSQRVVGVRHLKMGRNS